MKRGNRKVEQVRADGSIVEDYDTSLSQSEIAQVLERTFPDLRKAHAPLPFFLGEYQGVPFAIRCKNVTYLGHPHPFYKKRIQIADDLPEFYAAAKNLGCKPLLLGIYTYGSNTLFASFGIETYVNKAAHNSSAHLYSGDLAAAAEEGFFEKVDFFGNTVTLFRPDTVGVFLEECVAKPDGQPFSYAFGESPAAIENAGRIKRPAPEESAPVSASPLAASILPNIRRFFAQEAKRWYGIDCYKEMIEAGYKNRFQAEWVGFFLEYRFETYIEEHGLSDVFRYHQDKSAGGIDLDLFFPQIGAYGDLKAHSEDSRGIQGNDWDTVFSVIGRGRPKDHIYYIVCEHSTEKDSLYQYEVTRFWNSAREKTDLMSYHQRMKHNVTLKRAYVLDIHSGNCDHLKMFRQGINSNGRPRPPKIMIEREDLQYFMIDEMIL